MPVYRDAEGNIIEEKTRQGEPQPDGSQEVKTAPLAAQSGNQGAPPAAGRLDAPTKLMGQGDRDENTRVVGGRRRKEDEQRQQEQGAKDDAMSDPVVGWLVVVKGPGKGRGLRLGYGSNSIGRGQTDRVNLDFGDDQISRSNHAVVTYDPRGRKYYVQHGGGTNLTYLEDAPVLAPTELPALSHIAIGNTVLRFVPLCGDAFDWQDIEGETE